MINTNYISCVVKILETPKTKSIKETLMTKVRVLLPQKRKKRTVAIARLTFYDKLASNLLDYYKFNDYIIIEGYLSLLKRKNKKSKKIAIGVINVYPLFLTSNRVDNKI